MSEIATNVLVPDVITGSLVRGTGNPSAGAWADGVGEGCGVDAASGWGGERRRSTGRSASSGAPADESPDGALGDEDALGEALVVESVPGAGVLDGVAEGVASPR